MGADLGSYVPVVGQYGFITILALSCLILSGAILILKKAEAGKIAQGEVEIRIFGIILRVRWGQVEAPKEAATELPKSTISKLRRRLYRLRDKGSSKQSGSPPLNIADRLGEVDQP